jgi:hypothetical protein
MARSYAATLSAAGATLVPFELRDADSYDSTHTDNALDGGSFTVPTGGGVVVLNYAPKRGTLAITINGATAGLLEWDAPVGTGQVAVDYRTGRVEFASGDQGRTVVATYKHWGSVLDQTSLMRMMRAASETASAAVRRWDPVTVDLGEVDETGVEILDAQGRVFVLTGLTVVQPSDAGTVSQYPVVEAIIEAVGSTLTGEQLVEADAGGAWRYVVQGRLSTVPGNRGVLLKVLTEQISTGSTEAQIIPEGYLI